MTARTKNLGYFAGGAWVLCGLTVILLVEPARPADKPAPALWERTDGPFFSRDVLWAPAELTEPNLRRYYERLSNEVTLKRAWTVSVFVDADDASRELHGKIATEKGYDWWRELYEKFGRRLLPMAQIYGFGRSGVLRLRNAAGDSSETVLSGSNFLHVRLINIDYEVLEIYFHSLPPHSAPSAGDQAMISIYARASSFPRPDQAQEFSTLMQKRYQQKRVIVAIRTDSYFLEDVGFPILYRFDPGLRPPSREEYERSKTLYCFSDKPVVGCR